MTVQCFATDSKKWKRTVNNEVEYDKIGQSISMTFHMVYYDFFFPFSIYS